MAFTDFLPGFAIPAGLAFLAAPSALFPSSWVTVPLCALLLLTTAAFKNRQLFTIQRPVNGCMWGYVTVPQGEKWNVCTKSGKIQVVEGPKVLLVWGDKLVKLEQVAATQAQYLWVQFLDGRADIIQGPASVHLDTTIHKQVKVKDAVSLTDSEVLVIYREDRPDQAAEGSTMSSNAVARHVVRGPCLHVPKNPSEWTHEFCWHGNASNDPDHVGRKVKGAIRFTKLRACPDQTYFDVENVRTKDDALVTVKVMIFYRLKDIERMLHETHDPIADFINSVTSDVIEFVAGKSFEEFKASTDNLNNLTSYPQLTSRAKGIGFDVTKVVFRGYGAPQRLQKMHDDAIERRTKLALDRENEDQEQKMQDMKLAREEERLRKRQKMEKETKAHERELQREAHEAKQQEILRDRQSRLEHLAHMKTSLGLSGDQLASYLLASEQGPASKVIQIQGAPRDSSLQGSFIQLQESS
jgi:regulator of protease activity HflC (stomatin/prohibitin superfamily)